MPRRPVSSVWHLLVVLVAELPFSNEVETHEEADPNRVHRHDVPSNKMRQMYLRIPHHRLIFFVIDNSWTRDGAVVKGYKVLGAHSDFDERLTTSRDVSGVVRGVSVHFRHHTRILQKSISKGVFKNYYYKIAYAIEGLF